LFTNGTLITPRIADYLAEWPPYRVEITLYGATQETYERVTGIPGSYARCMRGIELLLERGLPLNLKTMLMTLNQDELHDMRTLADSLGVSFRYDAMLNAGLDGDGRPTSLRVPPEEVVRLDLQDQGRAEALRSFIQKKKSFQYPGDNLYACGAGERSFHIDPYGQLCLCMMVRYASYDLLAGSFQEGWGGLFPQIRSQKIEGNYICSQCELMPLCGQCPGWSSIEHGETQKPVDYLCQVAHLRYESLEALEKI
jgi:radical SAM protein with 4Fe4S-binding SPASM domain